MAHAVHLDEQTRADVERDGVWVATNARSNMNNAVGLAPASAHPRRALGTDGIGADPLISEAQAHFFRHAEAKDGLAMDAVARIVGAQKLAALRFEGEERAPQIAAGERADLVVLAYDPPTPMDATNLAGHFLFGLSSACVRDTIVRGRFVLKHGVVQGIDASRARRARPHRSRRAVDPHEERRLEMATIVPQRFEDLVRRMLVEHARTGAIYDLEPREIWRGPRPGFDLAIDNHGARIATGVGPAAGPHAQLAQNIALAWLGGSRILELKTIQVLDRLEIPCARASTPRTWASTWSGRRS